MGIVEELKTKKTLLFDGAMGTLLYSRGLKSGKSTEIYGYKNPEILLDIHKQYLQAGADIILTNTLGANELNLHSQKHTIEKIIDSSVKIAKKAILESENPNKKYIALDIGPMTKRLEPIGDLTAEELYEIHKRQVVQGEKSGVDLILIETMISLEEAKIAVKASKENTNLPVFCTMTFSKFQKTYMGETVDEIIKELEKLGVDAVGINCSQGPREIKPIVDRMLEVATVPIIVKPNAGLPQIIGDETKYDIDENEFASSMKYYIEKGVNMIGGCCGTNPKFIKELRKLLK